MNPHVTLALRIIGERYGDPDVCLRSVATTLRISDEHLCRLLKRHTGTTFRRHLVRTRVMAARRLVETTTLSMKEIAARTGFRDGSHFDHVFRAAFGNCPRSFRVRAVTVSPRDHQSAAGTP
jgi:transcriptional regulator GlxA family with amidase domain